MLKIPVIQKAEAEGSWVLGQSGQHSKTPLKNMKLVKQQTITKYLEVRGQSVVSEELLWH